MSLDSDSRAAPDRRIVHSLCALLCLLALAAFANHHHGSFLLASGVAAQQQHDERHSSFKPTAPPTSEKPTLPTNHAPSPPKKPPSPSRWCENAGVLCPSFLLIGERKCGTSSLFNYILQHPAILPPRTKEPQFFNGKKAATVEGTMQRIATYAKMFPRRSSSSSLSLSKDRQGDKKEEDACLEQVDLMPNGTIQSIPPLCRRRDPSVLRIIRKMSSGGDGSGDYATGESSATTFSKATPSVVRALLPNAQLVVILRCPLRRLTSHYDMHLRFASEGRKQYHRPPLAQVLAKELDKIARGGKKLDDLLLERAAKTEYIGPSVYAHHLLRWDREYSRDSRASGGGGGGSKKPWGSSSSSSRRRRGSDALMVLFQEDMDKASAAPSSLARFMCPVFKHIGVIPSSAVAATVTARGNRGGDDAMARARAAMTCQGLVGLFEAMSPGVNGGDARGSGTLVRINSKANLATAPPSSSSSSSSSSSFDSLPPPLLRRLCAEVFTKANGRLAERLAIHEGAGEEEEEVGLDGPPLERRRGELPGSWLCQKSEGRKLSKEIGLFQSTHDERM